MSILPERTPEQERAELAEARAWAEKVFDAGFSWITGPSEYGGRGLTRDYQRRYDELESRLRHARRCRPTGSAWAWWPRPSWPTPPRR